MKMGTIAQSPGFNNFAPGDALVAFAAANGMRVKGHALIWHGSVPPWVDALPPADLPDDASRTTSGTSAPTTAARCWHGML